MTNIDWTKPVETDEDPPRPVRVLGEITGQANRHIIAIYRRGVAVEVLYQVNDRGEVQGAGGLILRNVAPKPEPVLREAWINLYPRGLDGTFGSKAFADEHADDRNRLECRRITWMSDGSPVPGEMDPVRLSLDNIKLRTDLDRLRQEQEKTEARIAEFHDSLEWDELIAERDRLKAEVERLKPVYDAAAAWCRWYERNFVTNISQVTTLIDAVRDAEDKESGHD